MIAPDTSVVIAALSPWHEGHVRARAALAEKQRSLIGHVALESVSALSRLPRAHRVAPPVVLAALSAGFPDEWLVLDAPALEEELSAIVEAGIRGGAVYDALIGATASRHGARLVTADRRATVTYEALGVDATYV